MYIESRDQEKAPIKREERSREIRGARMKGRTGEHATGRGTGGQARTSDVGVRRGRGATDIGNVGTKCSKREMRGGTLDGRRLAVGVGRDGKGQGARGRWCRARRWREREKDRELEGGRDGGRESERERERGRERVRERR